MVTSEYDHGKRSEFVWISRRFEVGDHLMRFIRLFVELTFRFELRLRYFPQSIDAFALDKPTFGFFYEQLRIDYMRSKSEHISMNEAIELGSLEIRKLFKDLNSTALDKKVNMDYLEKELGLRKFFPQSLIDSQKVCLFK